MKFCCVTPCYNAERYIEKSIKSLLSQSVFKNPSNQLFYVLKDGGSTDKTVDKARSLFQKSGQNITTEIISGPDKGMYDALSTGLRKLPDGDIYSYINAGDYYSQYAFEIVADILCKEDVNFLTGLRCLYNEKNHLIGCSLPYKYDKNLFLKGFYGTFLPHVQQESTFWNHNLHKTIDFNQLKSFELAGDYYLWKNFIEKSPLYIVSAHLGGFKIHENQLSANYAGHYSKELKRIADKALWLDYLRAYREFIMWNLPDRLKKKFSKYIFSYDHNAREYKNNS